MKVKRYFAPTMRSALDKVKQEQGADVLILSNRKVDGGVELITADELSSQEAARLIQPRSARQPASAPATASSAPPANLAAGTDFASHDVLWTDSTVVQQMRDELANLKALLEAQLSGLAWSEFGSRHPLRARLMRVLGQVGICPGLARQVVGQIPDELDYRAGWHRALAILVMRLAAQSDPIVRDGGRIALVGATGVGKTTLVSKLAARFALKHGADQVAIISMDDRRLGAHQQMKAFGRLIGVAVHVARNVAELNAALGGSQRRRLVLIDTPGNAPSDARAADLAATLAAADTAIDVYGVLAANTDYLAAGRLVRAIANHDCQGAILTKLDEAATLGPSLSVLIEAELPLAYTSAGQRVPDDLDTVRPRILIERAITLARGEPAPRDRASFERAFSA